MIEKIPNPLSSASAATAFVQSYWQQCPAVIPAAISDAQRRAAPSARELLRLVQSDTAESRLITRSGSRWALEHGPLPAAQVPTLQSADWTVLIQGVDLILDSGRDLLEQFRFIPDARLDDLMISVAGDRGGVGPHVDDYDVFLLQLAGEREWQLAPPGDWALRDGQPLKLIRHFKPTQTERLSAGDMLYLPAGWAHNGIARGASTTASIGFRAPRRSELQVAWLQYAADQLGDLPVGSDPLYRDPTKRNQQQSGTRRWQQHPAKIPPEMMDSLTQWIKQWRPNAKTMREFVGCHLSEPKAQVWFERPSASVHRAAVNSMVRKGISLDRQTRMLWDGNAVFINGESYRPEKASLTVLRQLADTRGLPGAALKQLSASDREIVSEWLLLGWAHPNNP